MRDPAFQRGDVLNHLVRRLGGRLVRRTDHAVAIHIDAEPALGAGHDAAEVLGLEEVGQHAGLGHADHEIVDAVVERHVVAQVNQPARQPRHLGVFDQVLPAFRLGDLLGALEHRIQIAEAVDQLGRGLDADARHAGHVVSRIAGQRLDVDDALGPDAELLAHFGDADAPPLEAVVHGDGLADQLHHVLIG